MAPDWERYSRATVPRECQGPHLRLRPRTAPRGIAGERGKLPGRDTRNRSPERRNPLVPLLHILGRRKGGVPLWDIPRHCKVLKPRWVGPRTLQAPRTLMVGNVSDHCSNIERRSNASGIGAVNCTGPGLVLFCSRMASSCLFLTCFCREEMQVRLQADTALVLPDAAKVLCPEICVFPALTDSQETPVEKHEHETSIKHIHSL